MFTKRKVLSAIAKIYDPLQLIGPVIVKAKLIMQELWKREIGWDEELPEDLKTSWTIILNQLHLLNQIRIPRKVIESYPYKSLEIHGFSDASQVAYGCCVYVRVIDANEKISVKLLCAKSRVAPLKTIFMPPAAGMGVDASTLFVDIDTSTIRHQCHQCRQCRHCVNNIDNVGNCNM
jgi:hypothetical protein